MAIIRPTGNREVRMIAKRGYPAIPTNQGEFENGTILSIRTPYTNPPDPYYPDNNTNILYPHNGAFSKDGGIVEMNEGAAFYSDNGDEVDELDELHGTIPNWSHECGTNLLFHHGTGSEVHDDFPDLIERFDHCYDFPCCGRAWKLPRSGTMRAAISYEVMDGELVSFGFYTYVIAQGQHGFDFYGKAYDPVFNMANNFAYGQWALDSRFDFNSLQAFYTIGLVYRGTLTLKIRRILCSAYNN